MKLPRLPRLKRSFFLRPTLEVAAEFLGKYLVFETPEGKIVGEINEVEAYIGQDDPACHAAVGRRPRKGGGRTPRNEVMFWKGGHAYVYFTYGMYHCLNVVTEKENFPAAVLIRSIIPVEGTEILQKNRQRASQLARQRALPIPLEKLTNGPGKLCQAFNLSRQHNGIDLTSSPDFYIVDSGKKILNFKRGPRIGISKGKSLKWRFYY